MDKVNKWKILGNIPIYLMFLVLFVIILSFAIDGDWSSFFIVFGVILFLLVGVKWIKYCSDKQYESKELESYY